MFVVSSFPCFTPTRSIFQFGIFSPWVVYQFSVLIIQGVLTWWFHRPDYTKPLDEPSWGDSDEEGNSDVDMDADGVLDGEDESSDEYDDDDMAEDELVERVKAGKRGITA